MTSSYHIEDPRFKRTPVKTSLYLDRSEVNPVAIIEALKNPGKQIIVDNPSLVATILGRKVSTPSNIPVTKLIADWAKASDNTSPQDNRTLTELIQDLAVFSDKTIASTDITNEENTSHVILKRAMTADELSRRGVKTSEIFSVLENCVRHRTLHRKWQYCGLDGLASLRAMFVLKAPNVVELARFCIWRDDPLTEKVMNLKYNSPRSWTDWRTKIPVFEFLETYPGRETEQLCRDYLALDDKEARILGIPLFERAAKALLAVSPYESTVKELLKHRLGKVRGRAIIFCMSNSHIKWAKQISDRLISPKSN